MLPPEFTLWLVTRISDLFLVLSDGTVHMLDVGGGTFEKVADNREDFNNKIEDDENANNWLAIPLVDRLVDASILLHPGECYGFKKLPILGGDYTVDNLAPVSIADYLAVYGSVHEQLTGAPDGTGVRLKVNNPPTPKP